MCVLLLQSLTACSEKKEEAEYYRKDKNSAIELANGWYLFCDYEEIYKADGTYIDTYCTIDGMNLKYQNLLDFNIAITDNRTNEITGYLNPSVHGFCMNSEYKEKLTVISEYLKARNPKADLTSAELLFTDMANMLFHREDIVTVYNNAMKEGEKSAGKYSYISFSDIVKGSQLGDYYWQVGYMILTGNISAIEIELVKSDGILFSDTDTSALTSQESAILSEIDEIESCIIQQQSFVQVDYQFNKTISGIDFNKLYKLLNTIEEENEKNKGSGN